MGRYIRGGATVSGECDVCCVVAESPLAARCSEVGVGSVQPSEVGSALYSHAVGGFSFSAYDRDQDTRATGNCAISFGGDAPYWYFNCWNGSPWGGTGGACCSSYANAFFWIGAASNYSSYGAVYVR